MLGTQIWSRLLLRSQHTKYLQLNSNKANPLFISVNWEASGGGTFAVIPINEKGRLPDQLPLFRGHTAVVLDTDW
jgi:coronin-1B/1C/6